MRNGSRKAYAIIFLTFIIGLIAGLAAGSFVWRQNQTSAAGYQMIDDLSTELNLTQTQKTQVEKILNDSKQQFQELQKQMHPKFAEIRQQNREKIATVLTPEQKSLFEEWKQKQDAKRERDRKERRRAE